jgi:hypothetical protein
MDQRSSLPWPGIVAEKPRSPVSRGGKGKEDARNRYAATATILETLKVTPISWEIAFAAVTLLRPLAGRSFLWRGQPTRQLTWLGLAGQRQR